MNIKIFIIVLFVSGCQTTTEFIEPGGSIFTIKSGSDSLVTMKDKVRDVIVDNRGKPNIFESLLGWILLKTPDVTQAE